jgi:hypothetical protein
MQANWAAWDRDFPLRFLMVWENEEGEQELWAKAAGAEGLFADPVPLPREVLTLRGCEPDGLLRDALASGASLEQAGLGGLCVEVWDTICPVEWWGLADIALIAQRPGADPSLVDIVVGAGVEEPDRRHQPLPESPRFVLFNDWGRPAGRCQRVDGLYRSRAERSMTPVTLIGCEPAGLMSTLRRPRSWETAWAELLVLDQAGRAMTQRRISLAIDQVRPSVLGGALVDVTFADCFEPSPTAARPIWRAWHEGVPTEPNRWARFPTAGRREWLDLTFPAHAKGQADVSGGTYHLDGRFVTDMPGLHCAMAEALIGPGGYFGREWMAFKDCLAGGFGIALPFTLVWHDSEVARQALADAYGAPEEHHNYFEEIVDLLRCFGVTVVLE